MKKIFALLSATTIVTSLAFSAGSIQSSGDILAQQKGFRDRSIYNKSKASKAVPFHASSDSSIVPDIKSFKLNSIVMKGNDSFDKAMFWAVFDEYLGKTVTGKDAVSIMKKVTRIYTDNGYLLPVVKVEYVAPGSFKVNVIEGKIRNVDLVVSKDYEDEVVNNDLLQKYIDKILESAPAKTKDIQRYLLLINKIPGYSASYELKSIESGERKQGEVADLVLEIERAKLDLTFDIDDYGARDLGMYQFSAFSHLYNPTKHNDSLIAGYTTSNHPQKLKVMTAGYLKRLNSYGTSASVLWSYALDDGFSNGAKDDKNRSIKGQLSQYLVLNNKNSVRMDVGLNSQNVKQYQPGNLLDSYNYLQGFVGGKIKHKDFLQGENWLDPYAYFTLGRAHLNRSSSAITDFPQTFQSFKVSYFRDQPLPKDFSIFTQLIWQGSENNLPPEQQFFVDGRTIGRGYQPGVMSSNQGINADIELRYTKDVEKKYLNQIQFFGYYDISSFSKLQLQTSKSVLNSAGGGFRLFMPYDVRAEFEIDFPSARQLTVGGLTQRMPTRYQFLVGKSFRW